MIRTGGSTQDLSRLLKCASDFLEYRTSQDQLAVPNVVERCSRWVPPPGNHFKFNFDAAIFQEIPASRFRAIIQNEKGEVMASFLARGPPIADSEEAKILACRKALEFVVDTGSTDTVVEGDNTMVMNSISSSWTAYSRLGHLYEDVKCMAAGISNLTMNCVGHTANSAAHSLACYAKNIDDKIVWLENSPPPSLKALYFDNS